jgi:ribosomal protein L4
MCRGGRMFAPTKVYRHWHRRVNVAQKRYALASAIAASGVPGLVQARGHVIDGLAEVPFVVSDKIEGKTKTKEAAEFLRRAHLWGDIEKVCNISCIYNICVFSGVQLEALSRRQGQIAQSSLQEEVGSSGRVQQRW